MNGIEFKLWLEFEEVDPENWDIDNECTNIHVECQHGCHDGIILGHPKKTKNPYKIKILYG